MYLGIDVGGTKTIVASLDDKGVITESKKFPTAKDYKQFLKELKENIDSLNNKEFRAVGMGIPTTSFNRTAGIAYSFGNLPWSDVLIQSDIEKLTGCPVAIENDAKLAGLSESLVREPIRLLYITVSTGIGYSLIINQEIDPNIGDSGGRLMMFEREGKMVHWESFASGKAIVETFGKQAKDIKDKATWNKIAMNLRPGVSLLIAITEPDVIVIGGSVGVYFDRLEDPLTKALKEFETPLLQMPGLEAAKRPENAVVYGCYDYAKQVFNKA